MWTSARQRAEIRSGVERLRRDDEEARACRSLLAERAAAEGLAPSQTDGALVFYLARTAAGLVGRHGDDRYSTPYLADLRGVAELLNSGMRGLLNPS
jgi:hypothetical protein